MMRKLLGLLAFLALLLVGAIVLVIAIRTYDIQRGPALSVWHTHVPHDLRAGEIAKLDWDGYLQAEQRVFDEVRAEIVERIEPEERVASNRFFEGSPLYPGRFATDWNRSFVMAPDGPPLGAVVLLHGLTDSPYSMRAFAQLYRDRGFVAIAIRLPGHGTAPSGLTKAQWEDWTQATRLAVREARRRIGPAAPLHLLGYSNGGALATQYALDALADPQLSRPDRVVLVSPMIGVTAFARFAGIFGWPAFFPAFASATWLGIVTEYNPFKYNSFPINGARQSSLLTRELQGAITDAVASGRIARMPPILTFQSVVDFTVSTQAIVDSLYAVLPANGSELVLFDVNRHAQLAPLLRARSLDALDRILPAPPRNYRTAVIANGDKPSGVVVERGIDAGATVPTTRPLSIEYPTGMFSLSHIALPFAMDDPLYGIEAAPDAHKEFGINLGSVGGRGETGALIVNADALTRASSNPFLPYMLDRAAQAIAAPRTSAAAGRP
ncbi:MAG TPA: alpha/beta hydrolase [Burkholderiaceae bacterium]|jgi:alpha-beta hydrolase superfamily lysophospholipase|nr:alpha/beta hydrolase [Burkholderiaceae bacterium]